MKEYAPIFVTLNYCNEGHYDYAVQCKSVKGPHHSNGCSCGVNSKLKQACVNSMSYQSRCNALRAVRNVQKNADAVTHTWLPSSSK